METALWLFLVSEVMIEIDTKVLDQDRGEKFQIWEELGYRVNKLFGVGMSAKIE